MSYLLDTNVISEITKTTPHPAVAAWYAQRNEDDLYLSVVTLGEIRKGVELKRQSDRNRAAALDRMLTACKRNTRLACSPSTTSSPTSGGVWRS